MSQSQGFRFEHLASDAAARRGRLHTAHGSVETPAFMPVGTAATVKGLYPEQLSASGADMLLANTYHLMLRPGAERVAKLGGLHQFMNWTGPILTDSGGYQVMSLAELRKIDEHGVRFRSHIDGSKIELTPERAIEVQELLDATITMVLDECTPFPVDEMLAETSMQRSMRWAARCKEAFRPRPGYGLFGIVQGSIFDRLRRDSIAALLEIGFHGYALGGLAVGESQAEMFAVLDICEPLLPKEQPRYLMGVGKPADIVGAVARGIDLFDCVLPTRSGRTGQAFTHGGSVNLRNARHKEDPRPLDKRCACPTCAGYSRAYLCHLFRSGEMLGPMLLSQHNVYFYQSLMARLRDAIEAGQLQAFAECFLADQQAGDIPLLEA